MVGAAMAGVGYGTLAVFPSMPNYYGLKNYGGNYGVLYTAWRIGGFIGPVVAATAATRQRLRDGLLHLCRHAGCSTGAVFGAKPVTASQTTMTTSQTHS